MAPKKERKKFTLGSEQKVLDPNDPKLKSFIKGAQDRSLELKETLDPRAKPNKTLTLRLNGYQLELMRKVAEQEGRSIQKTILWYLMPLLEKKEREKNETILNS